MKKIFNILFLLSVGYSKTKWHQLDSSYTYEQYIKEFNKTYTNDQDYQFHKEVFQNRLTQIMIHNLDETQSYKLTVSKHTDLPYKEAQNYGYKSDLSNELKKQNKNQRFLSQTQQSLSPELLKDLPQSWDWRQQGKVTPVKNQESCGSCWAFTTIEVIESHAAINTGKLMTLSAQQLVDCVANPMQCGGDGGCQGLIPEVAFNYVQLYGIVSEDKMPYKAVQNQCTYDGSELKADIRTDGYQKLPENDYTSVMWHLYNKGPLTLSVFANQGWRDYDEGVFNGCPYNENISMNHAVTLVGYGTDEKQGDYWIVRNHWGESWGEDGYIRLARSSTPQCGYDTTPSQGSACRGDGQQTQYVCDTCAVIFDLSYPLNTRLAQDS